MKILDILCFTIYIYSIYKYIPVQYFKTSAINSLNSAYSTSTIHPSNLDMNFQRILFDM